MKKILVTGGVGFLGSHIVDKLLEEGHFVIALDNLMTSSKDNIKHNLSNPNFEFIRWDVTVPIKLEVDWIFSAASPASPKFYQKDPVKTINTILKGSINALELARQNNARVMLFSTSETYGQPLEHPQKESLWTHVNQTGIRSCYDLGKAASECIFMDYYRNWNVDIRIVRIFNTFGSRMQEDDGRFISNFICQAIRGKNLTVYGDGLQSRSISYVDDTIEGILKLMKSDYIFPMNIGADREHTVKEIAEIIISMVNPNLKIEYLPLPKDDPTRRCPDLTLAKEVIGFSPKTSIEEGLKKTIDYFRSIL